MTLLKKFILITRRVQVFVIDFFFKKSMHQNDIPHVTSLEIIG